MLSKIDDTQPVVVMTGLCKFDGNRSLNFRRNQKTKMIDISIGDEKKCEIDPKECAHFALDIVKLCVEVIYPEDQDAEDKTKKTDQSV